MNVRFIKSILFIVFVTIFVVIINKHSNNYTAFQVITTRAYTVKTGDTLSEIAEKYKPKDMKLSNYIEEIKYKNNIGNDIIQGKKLIIPIEK